jgi:hypothetical protein
MGTSEGSDRVYISLIRDDKNNFLRPHLSVYRHLHGYEFSTTIIFFFLNGIFGESGRDGGHLATLILHSFFQYR